MKIYSFKTISFNMSGARQPVFKEAVNVKDWLYGMLLTGFS